MKSCQIKIVDVGTQDPMQLLLMEDQQVVQALSSDTAQKAFTDGIGSWCVIRSCEHLDAARYLARAPTIRLCCHP